MSPTVFTITGTMLPADGGAPVKAFGALAYDRASGTLWACASASIPPSTAEKNSIEVGTITLGASTNGTGTGTYTPHFQSKGCINGLAVDPGTFGPAGSLWTSPNIASAISHYTSSGSLLGQEDIRSLLGCPGAPANSTNSGCNSGIAIGGGNFYLANPQTTTKRVFSVPPSFSSSTQVLSSSHRYEDMECDDVTYKPQTVIWVMWFNQNILKPLPISGTCTTAAPPPPPPGTFDVGDGGFTPTTMTSPQGATVTFTNTGTVTHSVADNTNLNLFPPTSLNPGTSTSYAYAAAGIFSVIDTTTTNTATVKVPLIAPASATQGTPVTISWASATPASGLAEDIQVEYPGTTSWATWLSKQTGTNAPFTPANGAGTYKFRARLRTTNSTTTHASAWSPAWSISVS